MKKPMFALTLLASLMTAAVAQADEIRTAVVCGATYQELNKASIGGCGSLAYGYFCDGNYAHVTITSISAPAVGPGMVCVSVTGTY